MLFAVRQTAISPPSFNFLWSALILMAVVLGGMGSTPGVVVGALVISLLPELLRGAENWRYFIFGVLLIIVMIFRPQGIWLTPTEQAVKKSSSDGSRVATRTTTVDVVPTRRPRGGPMSAVVLDVKGSPSPSVVCRPWTG